MEIIYKWMSNLLKFFWEILCFVCKIYGHYLWKWVHDDQNCYQVNVLRDKLGAFSEFWKSNYNPAWLSECSLYKKSPLMTVIFNKYIWGGKSSFNAERIGVLFSGTCKSSPQYPHAQSSQQCTTILTLRSCSV